MISWQEAVVIALASARICRMLIFEAGPGNLLGRFRRLLGADKPTKPGTFQELFNCSWCLSIWVSTSLFFLCIFAPEVIIFCWPLAIAYVAGALLSLF